MNGNAQTALILAGSIVGFVLFWCVLLVSIGIFGGWSKLAQSYRATERFEGERWSWQSAQFRWSCNYGGGLTVGASPQGLYLKMLFLFDFGHPPLFIPWSETTIEMKNSLLSGNYMEIRFPNVPGTLIRFSEKLAKKIAVAGFQTKPDSPT